MNPQTRQRMALLIEGHVQYQFMTITQIEKFYAAFYPGQWKKEAYYELMKIVAENNHERMFEYYVEDDEAYIFKIVNSSPAQETVYPVFKQNIDTYMSECPADSIECFKKQLDVIPRQNQN